MVTIAIDLRNRPHALYRFFSADGVLLYVGLTAEPGNRWRTHSREKPWWTDVKRVEVEHFPDRDSVEAAEIVAIKAEKPLHNVMHQVRPEVRPELRDLPVVPLPALGEPTPARRIDWIGRTEARAILEVSTAAVYRSLVNPDRRAAWWGAENVGWRYKPLSRRRIFQVSRARAAELARSGEQPDAE